MSRRYERKRREKQDRKQQLFQLLAQLTQSAGQGYNQSQDRAQRQQSLDSNQEYRNQALAQQQTQAGERNRLKERELDILASRQKASSAAEDPLEAQYTRLRNRNPRADLENSLGVPMPDASGGGGQFSGLDPDFQGKTDPELETRRMLLDLRQRLDARRQGGQPSQPPPPQQQPGMSASDMMSPGKIQEQLYRQVQQQQGSGGPGGAGQMQPGMGGMGGGGGGGMPPDGMPDQRPVAAMDQGPYGMPQDGSAMANLNEAWRLAMNPNAPPAVQMQAWQALSEFMPVEIPYDLQLQMQGPGGQMA